MNAKCVCVYRGVVSLAFCCLCACVPNMLRTMSMHAGNPLMPSWRARMRQLLSSKDHPLRVSTGLSPVACGLQNQKAEIHCPRLFESSLAREKQQTLHAAYETLPITTLFVLLAGGRRHPSTSSSSSAFSAASLTQSMELLHTERGDSTQGDMPSLGHGRNTGTRTLGVSKLARTSLRSVTGQPCMVLTSFIGAEAVALAVVIVAVAIVVAH